MSLSQVRVSPLQDPLAADDQPEKGTGEPPAEGPQQRGHPLPEGSPEVPVESATRRMEILRFRRFFLVDIPFAFFLLLSREVNGTSYRISQFLQISISASNYVKYFD